MSIMTDFVVSELVDTVITELTRHDLDIDKDEVNNKISQIESGIESASVAIVVTTVKGQLCLLFCDKKDLSFEKKPTVLNIRDKTDEVVSRLQKN